MFCESSGRQPQVRMQIWIHRKCFYLIDLLQLPSYHFRVLIAVLTLTSVMMQRCRVCHSVPMGANALMCQEISGWNHIVKPDLYYYSNFIYVCCVLACPIMLNPFRCECTVGWAGDWCDENINECASTPCMNDATCLNGPGMFRCACMPGWLSSLVAGSKIHVN